MKKLLNSIAAMAANIGIAGLVVFGVIYGVHGAQNLAILTIVIVGYAMFTGLSSDSILKSAQRYSSDLSIVRTFNRLVWVAIAAVYAWNGFMFMAFFSAFVLLMAVGRSALVRTKVSELVAMESGRAI